MAASPGSIHDNYGAFLRELSASSDPQGLATVFFRLAHTVDATAAALIETSPARPLGNAPPRLPRLVAANGPEPFWADFLDLCRSGRDLITRTLHISPHPVSLRELKHHPRLTKRVAALEAVLARHHLRDLFAVPGLGRKSPQTLAIMAGRNLDLRRSKRLLTGHMAIKILSQLAEPPPDGDASPARQQHNLTRRQFEIAHWLVAGKTDWEIGEILQISPKTVNYHVEKMKRLYGVHSRSQFIAAIVHEGGIAPSKPL